MAKVRWSLNIESKLLNDLRRIYDEESMANPKLPDNKSFNSYLNMILRKFALSKEQ